MAKSGEKMKKIAFQLLFIILFLLNQENVYSAGRVSFQIEMPSWEEAKEILPKYTKFTVMDVETGKQFRAQRRAGSNHADVQPLSAKDTKIMKKIYGGKWSWKRRAVIIIYKDQWIAASMHGMPHGAGALQNNFPGHFCIHFFGSTTHRSNFMDLSHQLMVLKAAGRLKEHLSNSSPYEIINAYVAGIKQQDLRIVSLTSLQKMKWKSVFNQIDNIKVSRMPMLPAEDLADQISLAVPIDIDMQIKGIGGRTFSGEVNLIRFSPNDMWKVDSAFLEEVLN